MSPPVALAQLSVPCLHAADGGQQNYRKLSDKLKEADLERRLEEEEVMLREKGVQMAREALERKKALMAGIPEGTTVGTISEFMFKARALPAA